MELCFVSVKPNYMNRIIQYGLIPGLAACLAGSINAQNKGSFFKSGDKVAFVGNSITNNGEFYHFLYLYYATRFPQEKLSFYNCGISGDMAGGVLKRLDKDVYSHEPTHTVLMIGMNDVRRNYYAESKQNDPAIPGLKVQALREYRTNTTQLMESFKAHRKKIILLKPTIYDQTGALPAERCYGVDNALDSCSLHVESLAKKYNTGLVDFRTIMKQINKKLQEKDSTATIIGKDRVHPGSPGHFVMAYQFLKTTGGTPYVSKLVINKKGNAEELINCAVSDVKQNGDNLSFSLQENSLPFPVEQEALPALEWVPFMEEYNRQVLQLTGMQKGEYELLIDGKSVGSYSAGALQQGINLAANSNTPQYRQALKVLEATLQVRKMQSVLRNLRFVEFKHLMGTTSADLKEVEVYLANRLEKELKGDHYEYHKKQFKTYVTNKAREEEFVTKLVAAEDKVYVLNKPVAHRYEIVKTK